ncbi:MAG TPA: MaoC/PaaZ C-terminal domain-containing protein [Jatrophihabitans sp.]|nr:MaoC/PaaZ C-terminal domain-containing protein [Jatrophihabitans sp.]
MTASVSLSTLTVGQPIPGQSFPIERATLVRYAGASGDFNPIHWSQETAVAVGLPNVIAHGMLTMAVAVRVVTDWLGDPGAVVEYGVRFTRPVVVEFGAATSLDVAGAVRSIDPAAGTAELDLTATVDGQTVLARSRVVVRLPA